MIAPLQPALFRAVCGNVAKPRAHLVGAAGSGMQALAEVLLARGWKLTGSDAQADSALWLRDRGVEMFVGHDARRIDASAQLLIYSDAVSADNVERQEATRRGIAQRSYPQALADLMAEHRGIAVAGTHGKSTTAAMIAEILSCAGMAPTVVVGASPLERENGGKAGDGEWLVAEACEYRANFLQLRPEISVVLGIEPDHFDFYRRPAEIETAFRQFVENTDGDGTVIASGDCPATRRAVRELSERVQTFGFTAGAHWYAAEIEHTHGRHRFSICKHGRTICQVNLRVPGRHQVSNALAAAATCHAAGAEDQAIAAGLAQFAGLRRRLEHVATVNGIDVLDDYAHHPTEIRATLAAVRMMYPGRRLWCVFQPHQISRTVALSEEFAGSLLGADRIAVAEVFAAREELSVDPGKLAEDLAHRIAARGGVVLPHCHAKTILSNIVAAVQPGDVVITLGAGDIRKICDELVDRI